MARSPKVYTELYVLVLDGAILTPDSFKQYWKNYGSGISGGIYGWRPPKKIYYTLGQAKAGLSHVPAQIQSKVEIHRFVSGGKVVETDQVLKDYDDRKAKKEIALKKKLLRWKLDSVQRDEKKIAQDRAEIARLEALLKLSKIDLDS